MLLNPAQMAAIAVELILMIVLPVGLLALWCRRRRVPFSVPLIAAAFYLLNLVVNVPLTTMLYPSLGLAPVALLALTALTYGVCEEVARWMSFRVGPMRRHRDRDGGVAAGLGHGGLESIVFALPYAIGTVVVLVSPAALPAATRDTLAGADPWLFVGTGLDRLPAMAAHVVFALLIVLAYRRGVRFLWLAIGAHAGLDFVMFTLRDYAPLPLFIGVWAAVAVAAVLLATRLWKALDGSAITSAAPSEVGPGRPEPARR